MVGYLDPSSSFVGVAAARSQSIARSADRLRGLHARRSSGSRRWSKNDAIVPKQTSYARVVSGEIPILIDYDFNAYRGPVPGQGNARFVIPKEGSVIVPYVMGLVKGGRTRRTARRCSTSCSPIRARRSSRNAFVRPIRPRAASPEARRSFCPMPNTPAPRASTSGRSRKRRRRSSSATWPKAADRPEQPDAAAATADGCIRRPAKFRTSRSRSFPPSSIFVAFFVLPFARLFVASWTAPPRAGAYTHRPDRSALPSSLAEHCGARCGRHLRDADRSRASPAFSSTATSFRAAPRPGRDADAAARLPRRRGRLHGDHAGRAPGR